MKNETKELIKEGLYLLFFAAAIFFIAMLLL